MVQMQGKVAVEYDDEAATLLADAVTDAGTDRDVNTAVAVDTLIQSTHAYWDNGELPMGLFWVNIHITAISGSGSTFQFALEVHDSSSFASAERVVGELNLLTTDGPGFYRFAVDAKTAEQLFANMTHMALSTTKATGSPSVTYTAWLSFAKAS